MKKTKDMLSQDGTRPVKQEFTKRKHISEYPTGPGFTAGHLAEINAGWRVFKPSIDLEKCIACYKCYMVCPDGVIYKQGPKGVAVDYDYCKGCGVCAHECPVKAIEMIKDKRD